MDDYERNNVTTERYSLVKKCLKDKFGYDKFKPCQYQIIDTILNLKDLIAVMPTGYGKSLCFQIVPLVTKEIAIVISPLIALMADQKMILDKLNISSCCYNSSLTMKGKRDIETDLMNGKYQIMYITPESLVSPNSYKVIEYIYTYIGICMIAIDEAHCVSSYGFDFRPKYREIFKIRDLLTNVPIMAVTATATDKVINDIKTLLYMEKCELIKTSFDRPNLNLCVKMQSNNTMDNITNIIKNSDGPCIIYCLTKSDTETMAARLTDAGIDTKAYHSGLTKEGRIKIQKDFMDGTYKCITATIAFGMGINKSDIRTIVHYGCPQNIESYYQEIGRAGRDGKKSNCYMFYKQKDFIIQRIFIEEIKDQRYKEFRSALLQQISQFVNTSECRRNFILRYFGQTPCNKNCNNCDNCNKCVLEKKQLNKRDEYKLFQILNTILSIRIAKNFSFGMSTIILILKGSNSKKIKDWMKNMTYYGSMKTMPNKDIGAIIYEAIEQGYIEDHDTGDCFRVLNCTDKGIEFGKEYECKLKNMVEH